MYTVTLTITDREFHTVLAALRVFQNVRAVFGFKDEILDIATNNGQVPVLTDAEIDALCARINDVA